MKTTFWALVALCACAACADDDDGNRASGRVAVPSDIRIERVGAASVRVSWQDNSTDEKGFDIWVRDAADATNRWIAGSVEADQTQYTISQGLEDGASYFFGVQGKGTSEAGDSRVVYEFFTLTPSSELPVVEIDGQPTATATCIAVTYRIDNAPSDARYGLCWSADGLPTTEDAMQYGPALPEDGGAVLQVIPNALLEYGREYTVRAFLTFGGATCYSSETKASLGEEPPAVTFDWTKLSHESLPAEIGLYETTGKLNGRNFHAWYAVADLSKGTVEFRVSVPEGAATIEEQSAAFGGDCYVMINGGYFYNGRHTGISVVDGETAGTIPAVRGSLRTSDTEEYDTMYNVTRGLFGVDASGTPGVCWAGTDARGAARYFDRPLPSVKGEARYDVVSAENPAPDIAWTPKYALSAGPVLLKDGKCPFDFTETPKGADYYLSNYEIMPYDIFGVGVSPDRTAVGSTADGRIVLFVCDGRIESSRGATLTELAAIMKGLGCTDAVNFDGGGSTGMVINGKHLNDTTAEASRAVVSTAGFFKKR